MTEREKRDLLQTGIKENDSYCQIFSVSAPQQGLLGQATVTQLLWLCSFQTRVVSCLFNLKCMKSAVELTLHTHSGRWWTAAFRATAQTQKVISDLTASISTLKPTVQPLSQSDSLSGISKMSPNTSRKQTAFWALSPTWLCAMQALT